MALESIDEIGAGQPLPPISENVVTNYVAKWRRLYEGDYSTLGIPAIATDVPGFAVNWFRRLATFYAEFQFGDRPSVNIRGDARVAPLLRNLNANLIPQLHVANIDMIRFGRGVLASHPMDPMRFQAFERDHHFEVMDLRGGVTADVLYRVRNSKLPEEEKTGIAKMVDVYKYPVNGTATWEVFSYNKGGLNSRLAIYDLAPRMGRQVVTFDANNDSTSLYEDIVEPLSEIARTMARTGYSIKRNLRPHLVMPAGAVISEDGNSVAMDEKGMVIPVDAGDASPSYLQWDNSLSAVEFYINTLRNHMLSMTGLSDLLFDPSLFPGELSGEALRRLLMAFWSKLNYFKGVNNGVIEQCLDIWNINRSVNDNELLDIDPANIEIDWPWQQLFMEALSNGQESDDEPEEIEEIESE